MRKFLLLLASVILGCGKPTQDELLARYLTNHADIKAAHYPKAVVVVSEDGCGHCNRAFADMVRPRTSNSNCLFIVRLEGGSLDMNGFMEKGPNLSFDDDRAFKKLGILQGSGLILLDGENIDTVIPVQLDNIQGRLERIRFLMDSIQG